MIVAATVAETGVVVMVKVAVLLPAATVTVLGGTALVLVEVNVMLSPPVGALPLRVTVPVELLPPRTEAGATVTLETVGGVMVRVAFWEPLPREPEIVAVVVVATAVVETVKFAEVDPAATVTEAGTVALALSELRLTGTPPVGATPLIVTVPVEGVEPATVVGDSESEVRVSTVTDSV